MILGLILILFLPIPFLAKIGIISAIVLVYRKNLLVTGSLFIGLMDIANRFPVESRNNDNILRKFAEKFYNNHFRLIKKFTNLPSQASIIIANYCQDRMENLACMLLPCNISIMMRDGLKKSIKLNKFVKWPLYTKASGNYDDTKKQIKECINQGRSVFSYITRNSEISPTFIPAIRSGIFHIAKELGVMITPVAFDYIDMNGGIISKQNFRIEVGEPFYVENPETDMRRTKIFFTKKLIEFKEKKYDAIF